MEQTCTTGDDQPLRTNAAPRRAKRRRVVPGSDEAALLTRRALARQRGSKVGIRTSRPAICGSCLAMRTNGAYRKATDAGRPGPRWPSKIESILGTCMPQNLSRDRRLACPLGTLRHTRITSRCVGKGLYALPNSSISEHRSLTEVCKHVPEGVVCFLSHELTTQAPFDVWLAIGEGAWRPHMDYPPLRMSVSLRLRSNPASRSIRLKESPFPNSPQRKLSLTVSSTATKSGSMLLLRHLGSAGGRDAAPWRTLAVRTRDLPWAKT